MTYENLQPCKKCGKRIVGGCNCPQKLFNCNQGQYNFQFMYCNDLEIDYSSTVLDGAMEKKRSAFGFMQRQALQIIVVNYESCWRLEGGNHEVEARPNRVRREQQNQISVRIAVKGSVPFWANHKVQHDTHGNADNGQSFGYFFAIQIRERQHRRDEFLSLP